MGTIRFVIRVDKILKNGTAPIDLLYQVSGERKAFRTDLRLYPASWDASTQQVIYNDKKAAKINCPGIDFNLLPSVNEVNEYNEDIRKLSDSVKAIEKRFKLDKISYSSQMVIDKIKEQSKGVTKIEGRSDILFEFMQKYIDDHKETREAGTLTVFKSVKRHLENYCRSTGKKVTFDNIDYSFFQSFQTYLLKDKTNEKGELVPGLSNNTAAKQLSTIKTFLNYARLQGFAVSDKYRDFKIKRETLEVIALTNEEFEHLFYMDLSDNKRLAETRDVFCFSCVTGLRYSDLNQLKREHIKKDEIRLHVTKTKQLLQIPLNSFSHLILEKYKDRLKPLPMISNQNLNYAVKDLCKLAGINEEIEIVRFRGAKREATVYPKHELIGVHNGRKTFATLSLEKGMSAEEVMAIGGWKDYKSFKRYVRITEKRNKVVMVKAWGNARKENYLKAV